MIEGLVAEILNDRELVINVGSESGVALGMKFSVLSSEQVEIKDPSTGELLGNMNLEKLRIEAVDVQQRFTICATFEKRIIGGALSAIGTISAMMKEIPREVDETFRHDEVLQMPQRERYIRKGDRIRQLTRLR